MDHFSGGQMDHHEQQQALAILLQLLQQQQQLNNETHQRNLLEHQQQQQQLLNQNLLDNLAATVLCNLKNGSNRNADAGVLEQLQQPQQGSSYSGSGGGGTSEVFPFPHPQNHTFPSFPMGQQQQNEAEQQLALLQLQQQLFYLQQLQQRQQFDGARDLLLSILSGGGGQNCNGFGAEGTVPEIPLDLSVGSSNGGGRSSRRRAEAMEQGSSLQNLLHQQQQQPKQYSFLPTCEHPKIDLGRQDAFCHRRSGGRSGAEFYVTGNSQKSCDGALNSNRTSVANSKNKRAKNEGWRWPNNNTDNRNIDSAATAAAGYGDSVIATDDGDYFFGAATTGSTVEDGRCSLSAISEHTSTSTEGTVLGSGAEQFAACEDSSNHSGGGQQRLSYPREFKLLVIEWYYANGQNKYRTCKDFQITKSMLNGWLQKAEKIHGSRPGSLKSGRSGRRPQFPSVERQLSELLRAELEAGHRVTNKWIRDTAKQLAKQQQHFGDQQDPSENTDEIVVVDNDDEGEGDGGEESQFTERWLNNFKKRYVFQQQQQQQQNPAYPTSLSNGGNINRDSETNSYSYQQQQFVDGSGVGGGDGNPSTASLEALFGAGASSPSSTTQLLQLAREICVESGASGCLPIEVFYRRYPMVELKRYRQLREQQHQNDGIDQRCF